MLITFYFLPEMTANNCQERSFASSRDSPKNSTKIMAISLKIFKTFPEVLLLCGFTSTQVGAIDSKTNPYFLSRVFQVGDENQVEAPSFGVQKAQHPVEGGSLSQVDQAGALSMIDHATLK